ncbi:MAG: hypothetical protein AAF378_10800 [Cyanobacteria bacterium P01_A01_bin.84]
MLKQIKLAALGLVAASAILPVASPASAAFSETAQESVAGIKTEVPQEELVAGRRYYRVRRVRVYRPVRRYRRRYRVRRRVCTRYRRYRFRTRYGYRYRTVCLRYRNVYRRY